MLKALSTSICSSQKVSGHARFLFWGGLCVPAHYLVRDPVAKHAVVISKLTSSSIEYINDGLGGGKYSHVIS